LNQVGAAFPDWNARRRRFAQEIWLVELYFFHRGRAFGI